jgi:hypothetical protein
MKIFLKSVLTFLFALAFTNVNSQVTTGYIFGLNLSTMTLKNKDISSTPETLPGIHFGGAIEIPVIGDFALNPGLLFSAKGTTYKIDTLEYSISPIYIEVPVIAVYSFGSDEVKITVFAGPYFAFGVAGYKIQPGGELKNLSFGTGKNNDLKTLDWGLNLGAGVNIKGLLISAQYGIGLANVSPLTTPDSEMKNRVIGITISSLFDRKQ